MLFNNYRIIAITKCILFVFQIPDLEDGGLSFCILDLAAHYHFNKLGQGDSDYLDKFALVIIGIGEAEPLGKVHRNSFREYCGGRNDISYMGERFAKRARFLAKLSKSRFSSVLARIVKLARGNFKEDAAVRISVLLYADDLALISERYNADGTEVLCIFPFCLLTVGLDYVVTINVHNRGVENEIFGFGFFFKVHIIL